MPDMGRKLYFRQIGKSNVEKPPVVDESEINLFIKYKGDNQKNIRFYARSKIREFKKKYKINTIEYVNLTANCKICNFSELIQIHHVISKSDGGTDTIDNYIGLCPNCHSLHHLKRWSLEKIKSWYESKNK